MQSAETVLDVLRDRGRKGLPCNELYRQMFNRDLYLLAYGRIYAQWPCLKAVSELRLILSPQLQSGPADLHPEKERETAPAGTAVLVEQARRRSGAPAVGGIL